MTKIKSDYCIFKKIVIYLIRYDKANLVPIQYFNGTRTYI